MRTYKQLTNLNANQLALIAELQHHQNGTITINDTTVSFQSNVQATLQDVKELISFGYLAVTSQPTEVVECVMSDLSKFLNLTTRQFELPDLPVIPAEKKSDVDEVIDILENGVDIDGEMIDVPGIIVTEDEAYNFADDEEGTQVKFDLETVQWMIHHQMLITDDGITYHIPEKMFH